MRVRKRSLLWVVCWVALGAGAAGAAEVPMLPLDTAEGAKLAMRPRGAEAALDVVKGEGNTTDGGGALRLRATSPTAEGNKYFSFLISLKEPADLRERRLLLDARTGSPEETKAFYLRLYNKGEAKPAWSFHSWDGQLKPAWRTFSIQGGLCPDGLSWEPEVVENRVADRVDRIEVIIGTAGDGKGIDVSIDNLRTAERLQGIQDLKAPKALVRDTLLVADGKPAATILRPDTDAGRKAAQVVADAVRAQTGVTLPARPAARADREREPAETLLLLGNVDNNPALLLPYARYLTPVDAVCPGAGGYLVHTVHDPFGKGVNEVVVGATDDAGLARAAGAFAAVVAKQPKGPTLRLPRTFERGYGESFLKRYGWAASNPSPKRMEDGMTSGRRALDEGRHCSIAGELQNVALRYQLTGHAVEARLFVALFDLYAQSAVADPRKYGGPWGFDSDFPSAQVVCGWDCIEEDPSLTDEERLRVTKILARWLSEAVLTKVGNSLAHVPHNHQTFPGLGTLMGGLYFSHGYTVIESPKWLAIADNLFKPQAARFKPMEDCNGYQWLTNGHQMRYAVARPDFTLLTGPAGQKVIDYCVGTMNNLGYQVPYGDTGSWRCWDSELACLDVFAYATGDPVATWVGGLKRRNRNLLEPYAFYRAGEGERPTRFDGVKAWPLEPMYYETFPAEGRPALERCFDKVTFREAMDPSAAYLLLDGLSNGGHKHLDGNSIPQLTQFERIWLADNDYIKAQTKYHNTVLVFKDGQATAIPDYAELVGAGETERYGYSRTRVAGYSGVDWDRTVVWLKGARAFLVLDRMQAKEAAEYQFRTLWQGVGESVPAADGVLLRQKGPSMRLQVAPGPRVSVVDDADLGATWGGYPFADPVTRTVTATATVRLKAGESYLCATVLHGSARGDAGPWKVAHLDGAEGVRVVTGQGVVAVGLGPASKAVPGINLSTDAQVWVADAQGVTLLDGARASLGRAPLHRSAAPECVDLDAGVAKSLALIPTRAAARNVEAGAKAPAHPVVWVQRPAPERLIVSGNRGLPGSVNLGARIACEPAPAKANVLDPNAPNKPEVLLDGAAVNNTGTCVMWEPDKTVTLTVDLGAPCRVDRIRWNQWWATSSSKNTSYLPEQTTVLVSSDAFRQDSRTVGTVTDAGPHPSFGSPIEYSADAAKAVARYVRLVLKPKAGSAIYLAEVMVEGQPVGPAADAVPFAFTRVVPARLGAGAPAGLYVATEQGSLLAVGADGARRWAKTLGAAILDVASADLDGDGRDEAILGRQDCFVTALDDDGKELWSKQIPFYRERPVVTCVMAGDLDGDGKPEVVAGAHNWRFYAFKADGTELWNYETVRKSLSGAVADIDGDGKDEVLCGTEYYSTTTLKGDGTRLWSYSFGPICHQVATGSFDGDKTRGAVYGGGDGFIHYVGADGKMRMRFQTGEEVRHVATGDLDADGKDEILAGSQNDSLYCFGADAKLRWRRDLGAEVTALAVAGDLVVAGTADGTLFTLDKAGTPVALSKLKSRIVQTAPCEGGVVLATADGRLRRVRPRP